MNLIPTIMVCNEERFITQVLTPVCAVFPHVIVADTGSQDTTLKQIKQFPGVYLMNVGVLPLERLGILRNEMADIAASEYGATHTMKIDGDEIYTTSCLRSIVSEPLPADKTAGYTRCIEIVELENGEVWKTNADYDAVVIYPVSARWGGVYPFEYPRFPKEVDPYFHEEFKHKWGNASFYHLHHMLSRSSKDNETPWRSRKKNQYALRDAPDLKLTQLLYASWKEYKDE
jgi:hypothetical protein